MKKNIIPLFLLMLALVFAAGCKKGGEAASGETLDKDTSYAFGMFIAAQFSLPGVTYDYDAFVEGHKDFLAGKTRLTNEEAMEKIQTTYMAVMGNQAQGFMEAEDVFLSENGQKPGIISTPSGLQYEIITQGTGRRPGIDDTVRVHYRGTLIDGTVFDSSYDRGEPAEFPLGGVIPGWTEGLQLMNEGSIFRLFIPSMLAYGEEGTQNIPPYAPLIFDVELLSIVNK